MKRKFSLSFELQQHKDVTIRQRVGCSWIPENLPAGPTCFQMVQRLNYKRLNFSPLEKLDSLDQESFSSNPLKIQTSFNSDLCFAHKHCGENELRLLLRIKGTCQTVES